MTRRELVDATYDAAERLNELKMQHGRISKRRGRGVARSIAEARALRSRLDDEMAHGRGGARRLQRSRGKYRASASPPYATSASCSGRGACSISESRRSRASSAAISASRAPRALAVAPCGHRVFNCLEAACARRLCGSRCRSCRSPRMTRCDARRHRGLLLERHCAWRMTAAALGGVVRFEFLPDFLRELPAGEPRTSRACRARPSGGPTPRCSPECAATDPGKTSAACGSCRSSRECRIRSSNARCASVPEKAVHLVAGRAERVGFRIFETADESAGQTDRR